MSERYMVTGVQLGMLQALNDKYERAKLIEEIIENQYIGNLCTECDNDCDEDEVGGCIADYGKHQPNNKDCDCINCCNK